ncbi:MAG: hypothetical protein GYA48_13365 [Chloroflexi bacterium]|nr:hypothetical protein [Chloroflexota bacterium]
MGYPIPRLRRCPFPALQGRGKGPAHDVCVMSGSLQGVDVTLNICSIRSFAV